MLGHVEKSARVGGNCSGTGFPPAKPPGRAVASTPRAVSRTIIDVGDDAHAIAFAAHGAAGPAVICQLGSDGGPDMERPCRAGATGVFQFAFSRHPVFPTGDLVWAPPQPVRLSPRDTPH